MPIVLSISSQVVRGHVGNSAAVPALMALGIEVWPLPTIVLSNHPDHGRTATRRTGADDLTAMLETLESFGWLEQVASVLTGYFAHSRQVTAIAAIIVRLKAARPGLIYCCDPIMGDDPGGLYVPEAVADAIAAELVPIADIVTPNRFELARLSGRDIYVVHDAVEAARGLGNSELIATSIPDIGERLATLAIQRDAVWQSSTDRRRDVPKGTGDLLAALYFGHRLNVRPPDDALGRALGGVKLMIDLSARRDELALTAALPGLADAMPVAVTPHA